MRESDSFWSWMWLRPAGRLYSPAEVAIHMLAVALISALVAGCPSSDEVPKPNDDTSKPADEGRDTREPPAATETGKEQT